MGQGLALAESKDDVVCNHMAQVYRQAFRQPFELGKIKQVNGVDLPPPGEDKLRLYRVKYSFYPTSPEFDAIRWRVGKYSHIYAGKDEGERVMITSEFDINNDGIKESVVKSQFFDGSGTGFDVLRVFEQGELDLSREVTSIDLSRGHNGKTPPSYIAGGAIIRPLIFQGVTYQRTGS